MRTNCLDAYFKQLKTEIVVLTYRSVQPSEPPGSCQRLHYIFPAIVPPVACFAAGHRTICKQDLAALDVAHPKLLRRVVGPPAGMDWSRPWHEIVHDWERASFNFCGPGRLQTLVANMFGTILETS